MSTIIAHIMARDAEEGAYNDSTHIRLLLTFLTLVTFGLTAVSILLFIRFRRRMAERRSSLPLYEEAIQRPSSARSNHRRLVVRPENDYVYQEKQMLMACSDAPPPTSPVPEIRITFPEDMDLAGRPQSGRIVVVHVGDSTVGYSPYDEKLPPYQQSESDRFQSLDLERIGGLKEKEYYH